MISCGINSGTASALDAGSKLFRTDIRMALTQNIDLSNLLGLERLEILQPLTVASLDERNK